MTPPLAQARLAVETADAVLFVVDVTVGITGFNPYRTSQLAYSDLWKKAGMGEDEAKIYLGAINDSMNSPNMILDLMRHTCGLPYGNRGNTAIHRRFPPGSHAAAAAMNGAEFLDRLASAPLLHQPGRVWDYGFGLDVLGLVIEKVSGQNLGQFLEAAELLDAPVGVAAAGAHGADVAQSCAVADADGDRDDLTATVRAVYREWKTQRIDEHLDDVARMAFGRGALVALTPGTPGHVFGTSNPKTGSVWNSTCLSSPVSAASIAGPSSANSSGSGTSASTGSHATSARFSPSRARRRSSMRKRRSPIARMPSNPSGCCEKSTMRASVPTS